MLLRALLGVWALLFMTGLMVVGLAVGAGLLLRALLRGRRPVTGLRHARMHWQQRVRRCAGAAPVASGDVVEGQAREIYHRAWP